MDVIERAADKIADNQEKLKAGQIKQEEYDKSLAEKKQRVDEIVDKQPKSAAVQTSGARFAIQAGDYPSAINRASTAMNLAPNDPFPVTTRGLAYYNSGDFPRAAADAKRALALAPDDPVAKAIYELSKDRVPGNGGSGLQQALASARRELATLPQSPYVAAGDLSGARVGGLRTEDDPEVARYQSEQGRRLVRRMIAAEKAMLRKDFFSAFGHANEALAMSPGDNPRAQIVRAVSAWNLGEYCTTIADASKVLQALKGGDPNAHPMLVARAAASSELGRYSDALRDAQAAIAFFPQSGRAHLERAIAKEGLRDTPESVLADFKRAAELDARFTPDYDRALARLMPAAKPEREAAPAAGASASARGLVADLMRQGEEALSSTWGFAAVCAALVGLFAVSAFAIRRRS